MKTIVQRIEDVRSYVANELRDVPGSSSYIMQLDNIAHDVSLIETCPHGVLPVNCRRCKAVAYRDLDFWIGLFWDRKKRTLYIFPVPMLGIRLELGE